MPGPQPPRKRPSALPWRAHQNKSLLHHNRCRRLLYLFKWLHGLVGCLRRGRSDCFWHGQGGSV